MKNELTLQNIRQKLDRVDYEILKLLNARMELAIKTKKFKKKITDLSRENEVLENIRKNSRGLIAPDFCEKLYLEIISESKKLQNREFQLVGFQGEHGAYSEVAIKKWRSEFVPIPCSEFADVFNGVMSEIYDFGVVPVENTLGGVVTPVNELLINTDIFVVGAVELPIHHCLLVLPDTDYREIRVVYSHSQALSQCRGFLKRNKLESVPYYDTAGAAKMLVEKAPKASAVIASKFAAEYYNLKIIKENIEDLDTNNTRFLILSKDENKELGEKCSVIFRTNHKAGTLFKVLEVFAKLNINLTRIESVPDEPGNYAFFLDFLGSLKDDKVLNAIEKVKKITNKFKLMGCYLEKRLDQ
jgi:prephenate dehydratase/chorismate mutase/prephenate dehydratase